MKPLLDWLKQTGMSRVLWGTDMDWTFLKNDSADARGAPAPQHVVDTCRDLDNVTHGKFYIVTGRDIGSVDRIMGGAEFKVSGEYNNMERFDPPAKPVDLGARPRWDLIDNDLKTLTAQWPDAMLRIKPFMRTLNISRSPGLLDPANHAAVAKDLRRLLDRITAVTGQQLDNIDGGKVFDMCPAGRDKHGGYSDVFNHAAKHYKGLEPLVALYLGDSEGDVPAAKFVQANGGKFVSVGKDPAVTSIADFKLADTDECLAVMRAAARLPKGP